VWVYHLLSQPPSQQPESVIPGWNNYIQDAWACNNGWTAYFPNQYDSVQWLYKGFVVQSGNKLKFAVYTTDNLPNYSCDDGFPTLCNGNLIMSMRVWKNGHAWERTATGYAHVANHPMGDCVSFTYDVPNLFNAPANTHFYLGDFND